MCFFKYYYNNTIKYDLLNKFQYKNIKKIPKLKKIILSFKYNNINFKELASGMIALELLTSQKSAIIKSRNSNIALKIRKGNPIGCKLILRKTLMYLFFIKLITQFFPYLKQFKGHYNKNFNNSIKSFSFKLKKVLFFNELENHYQIFNKLPVLQVIIITNTISFNELYFLLKSFKFPICINK